LSTIKKALIIFHYTEKTKSNLIIAANLLETVSSIKEEEKAGADKLLIAYINALILEVNIAANASGVQEFREINAKLEEVTKNIAQHNYLNAMKLVSEAISMATTRGNKAAETLKEKDLI